MDSANSTSAASQGIQQVPRHRHMSMSQRIDQMSSMIDKATSDGKLTADQATEMKKQLDEIKTMLADAKTSGIPLTEDQRRQIRDEMKTVGKQLYSTAGNPPPASTSNFESATAVNNLFAKIDANGDGTIDKDEFADFVKKLKENTNGLADYLRKATYDQAGNLSITMTQASSLSIQA
jgi:hypothetical protein